MIRIWDYFMRRKGLLLALIAAFLMSSMLSYQALNSNASEREIPYITIEDWGELIEVPKTGGEQAPIILSVLNAKDVTELEPREGIEKPEVENNELVATEPIELAPDEPVKTENNLLSNVWLALAGVAILALGLYLTYQHFMR